MAEEVEMTPVTLDDAATVPPKVSPFGARPTETAAPAAASPVPAAPAAAAPAAAVPAAPALPSSGVSTIKLKPVIRKPQIRKPVIGGVKPPATVAAAASPEVTKKATQSLKAVTGPIPMQATLRKTGIVAEGILTPAQQQAAKSKTSRISLESAIGVAPVKEAPAPMKTIRLRRPTDLKSNGPAPLVSSQPPVSEPPAAPVAGSEASTEGETSVTQKKTLKLHRPGIGIKRPTISSAPAASAAPAEGDVPEMPVADMAPVGNLSPVGMAGGESGKSAGVPGWVAVMSLITSIAALAAVGFLMWHLWQEGVGPVAGANEMQFIQMD